VSVGAESSRHSAAACLCLALALAIAVDEPGRADACITLASATGGAGKATWLGIRAEGLSTGGVGTLASMRADLENERDALAWRYDGS
jgi:hypothetical protein